ncbi:tetratricopeptide repeat protein [Massilia agilis]|uniref:Tetratricopeptide repeat protein n=1 Tax=Massilia agilis TaxID=1811226 RepID=A0ABT2DEK2_9BURK|nr:tetratricopeptide repeat-containing response regulator [Massilia agilis]MCS0809269.1 tetratricopeptide repeat protein [Massilia agilis]
MNQLDGLSALIIDPNAGMRTSVQNMLTMIGLSTITGVASSNQAIKQVAAKPYDLILCEYELGGGQDGQQLLEDLRHHRLIPLSTMFFMVTAEGDYGRVVSAAELAPTDYILKPFNADRLLERITRALERRRAFMPAHTLIDAGHQREAIAACLEAEQAFPRYALEFQRLRAEQLMLQGEFDQAEPIYRALAEEKQIPWARLGLAKTLFERARYDEAQAILEELVASNKNFVDAYDWLARTHAALGALDKSQGVLADAVAVSPHVVRRLRTLGETALAAGDADTAEKSLRQVVTKAKYSEFRDPEDHVKLVRALVTKNEPDQAAAVIRDLDRSLGGQKNASACSAISSMMLHQHTGNTDRLNESLKAAMAACKDAPELSPELKLELARTCLANGMEEGAAEVVRDVMRNASGDAAMAKAMDVLQQAGHGEMAARLAQETRQQVVDLVASGAAKARAGDYLGAVELMQEAAAKMPGNPAVAFNAALAILRCLEHAGWDDKLAASVPGLVDSVRRLDGRNPKLPALVALHQQVLRKYNKGPRIRKAG